MWQHHDVIHAMRMDALRAEAERERRWLVHDLANGRGSTMRTPGRGRALAARGVAAVSRGAARIARRLDARVAGELGPDRLLRDV